MTVSVDRAVGSLGRYHRVVSSRIPEADVVSEARFVMAASDGRGLGLRLLGGVAVNLHAEPSLHPAFCRSYKDIDVVVPRRAGGEIGRLLVELGYESNPTFNAMNGNRRQLYYDVPNDRQLDVFIDRFEMCHAIPLSGRLSVDRVSIPLAELLLTKLQVFELNEKDRRDALAILHHHQIEDHDVDAVNGDVVAALLAADWGLWRTTTMNLDRAAAALPEYQLSDDERSTLEQRLEALRLRIEAEPKSRKWKLRGRVGDRVRWYEEPEEVE
jgi:hypothetical protein